MAITQDNRLLKLTTPLGPDVLLIESFSGSEEISRPFHFVLKLRAEVAVGSPAKVVANKLIGQHMTLEIELPEKKKRFIDGLCRTFTKEGQDERFAYYQAEIVPWFSFLDLKADCRIFQNMTVMEVIQTVVAELGFSALYRSDAVDGKRPRWDYCVQYRETTFNFLSRLMEEEAFYYYFEHEEGKHTFVLFGGDNSKLKDCPQQSEFVYRPEKGILEYDDTVESWEIRQQLFSSKWTLRDHHFEIPDTPLEVESTSAFATEANAALDIFDYPGEYARKYNLPGKTGKLMEDGEHMAISHVIVEEANFITYEGSSHCRAFTTGYKVKLEGKKHLATDSYLLTVVHHTGIQHPAYLSSEQVGGAHYSNTFKCMKAKDTFLPERLTPKPVIHGLQTAKVIDEHPEPQEEIWPDEFGRVMVRFHWDRLAKHACWIRVVQPWAGNNWGQQWIPRVGDEVVVAFLEGDPDRPVIVGSVYHGLNKPPFELPKNKTQSGILTHSSPKGTKKNFNMLRFEDKKGSEEIYVHAEKDLTTRVENDETRTVDNNRTTTIHQNDTETVDKGNHTLTVSEGNREATISKGNDSLKIDTGNREATISMGNDKLTVSMGGVTHEVPMGAYKVTALNIELTGTAGIKLVCGGSSIEMTPMSISITSPLVKIN